MSEEAAAKVFGKPILDDPDLVFWNKVMNSRLETAITNDSEFQRILKEIDNADVPMPNVIRDIPTGITHDIFKTSTGVQTLWLTANAPDYTFLSEWYGPNCYQELFNISKEKDILLFENSDMFYFADLENLKGVFTEFTTKKVFQLNGDDTLDELERLGFY